MLVASLFQNRAQLRKRMNELFREKGYGIMEKRFVMGEVLGFAPNLKDLTAEEMEQIISFLQKEPN